MQVTLYSAGVRPEVTAHIINAGHGLVECASVLSQLEHALINSDGLILQDFAYSAEVAALAARAPKLKWIQLLTSGYDRIKTLGAPAHVTVSNARGAFTPSVAIHAVAMYLALLRGIPQALRQQETASWQRDYASTLAIPEGARILIGGFGSIGQEIARLLRPMSPYIIGISRSGRAHALADEMHNADQFRALLPNADAIFLAMPLDEQTRHCLGAAEFSMCKKSALIINVGRGALTDQIALASALETGMIAGAATDVTDPEPLPADHPLWRAPNFLLSPHVSGAAGETGFRNQAQAAIANLERFRNGQPLENIIVLKDQTS